MSTRQTIRFGTETWAKGTRGLLAPSATDQPRLLNMRFDPQGLLMPRPRWVKRFTISSAVQASRIFPARYFNTSTAPGAFEDGYCYLTNGGVAFYSPIGALVATDTWGVEPNRNITEHLTVHALSEYEWLVGPYYVKLRGPGTAGGPHAAGVQIQVIGVDAQISSTFGNYVDVQGAAVHQGRAYYWGPAFVGGFKERRNRVYWSDSAITGGTTAYRTFSSSTQYFDVDGAVAGCASVGSTLLIWTEQGSWVAMQGPNPGAATFSDVGKGKVPGRFRWPALFDRTAVFSAADQTGLVVVSSGGSLDDAGLAHLGGRRTPQAYQLNPPYSVVANSVANTVLAAVAWETDRDFSLGFYHLSRGVWTEETWDTGTFPTNNTRQYAANEDSGTEMAAFFELSGSTLEVWTRDLGNAAPPIDIAGTSNERPRGQVWLPRIFQPDKDVRVVRVVVDGYVVMTSGTPSLTISVKDGEGNTNALAQNPGASPLPNTASKTAFRLVGSGMLPFTSFSDVVLSNIHGVVIESVSVDFETNAGQVF